MRGVAPEDLHRRETGPSRERDLTLRAEYFRWKYESKMRNAPVPMTPPSRSALGQRRTLKEYLVGTHQERSFGYACSSTVSANGPPLLLPLLRRAHAPHFSDSAPRYPPLLSHSLPFASPSLLSLPKVFQRQGLSNRSTWVPCRGGSGVSRDKKGSS